ncbi:MAG: peptide chain release factor aRF-1 [Candidatus Heimdallarchaeota archaeon]|nr:peptide chain release factor aRF-1 [Candidatus Heimdallarchaeota archaeon]
MVKEDKKEKRSSVEIYMLRQSIKRLEQKRSFNMSTSLVTLYIPPKTRLSDITNQLRDELGTATNIKDRTTGKAVASALQSIISRMKNVINGENGLVIYCGMTGLNNMEYHLIVPPEPVGIKLYMCDSIFHTDHLKEMLEPKKKYGLMIVSRGGATFATLTGSTLNIIKNEDSYVPKKHKMGGQSQRRFERLVEEAATRWYNKMGEMMNQIYLEDYPVEAIVVGGPAISNSQYLESKSIDYRIKEKVLGIYDVGYTEYAGIKELMGQAQDKLADFELIQERKLMNRFLEHLGKDTGLVTYGEKAVRDVLEKGAVDIVLISEQVDKVNITLKCNECNHSYTETVITSKYDAFIKNLSDMKCPKCGETRVEIKNESDFVEEINEIAKSSGATVEMISSIHEDGAILYNTFGGIAAILRYKVFDY